MARSAYDLRPDTGNDWLTKAACRGHNPDWWTIPNPGNETAKAICGGCPVRRQCAERAEHLGIRGMVIAGRAHRRHGEYRTVTAVSLLCRRPTCRRRFDAVNAKQRYCSDGCRSMDHSRIAKARRAT